MEVWYVAKDTRVVGVVRLNSLFKYSNSHPFRS